MKEKLLVLAKAAPIVSKSYEHLVCVAGITDKGEWRRVYPVQWKAFFKGDDRRFKKKSWIEYELESPEPSDHRPESRKIKDTTIKPGADESFAAIKKLLDARLTTLEALAEKGAKTVSLGVIKPIILDFVEDDNRHYEVSIEKQKQLTLGGEKAVKLEIPKKTYSYRFKCSPGCPTTHDIYCEDWELIELYRHCEDYRKQGRYADEAEVFQKVKQRMLDDMLKKKEVYFVVGTHHVFGTYLIVGIIYPKKTDRY